MQLTDQRKTFFATFGYLHFPGLFRDDVGWIVDEFEKTFDRMTGDGTAIPRHDGTKRTALVPFADSSERLCTLLDDERVAGPIGDLLGQDFNYLTSDGNYYTGDTGWHSDNWNRALRWIKIAFYLDPLGRESGALRVIPGSHRMGEGYAEEVNRTVPRSGEILGVRSGRDIPAVALDTEPGDMVLFNQKLKHASFGGDTRRRMFTLNFCNHAGTPEEIVELRNIIGAQARFWITQIHGETMRRTAGPERMAHLRQMMENDDHMPALVERYRAEQSEPSRG